MLDVKYKIVRCIKEHINPKPSKKTNLKKFEKRA